VGRRAHRRRRGDGADRVLYALVDDDLKRLLAYSTVENVGLHGARSRGGVSVSQRRAAGAAALAFAAALLHAVNHAAFKGVLFLGAGSVLHATGLRDMNRLGGLVNRAPWTAASFLVGSLAIAALPPLKRLRERMAALPVVSAGRREFACVHRRLPHAGRRGARTDGRSRGRDLREGLRRLLPGDAAVGRG